MLRSVTTEARKAGAEVKKAWAHKTGNVWEFHYGKFYWWGRAENAWHARAKGWQEWLEAKTTGRLPA